MPFDRTVMGVRIINVGSVGEAPGDVPHAHATFVEQGPDGEWSVDQAIVPLAGPG